MVMPGWPHAYADNNFEGIIIQDHFKCLNRPIVGSKMMIKSEDCRRAYRRLLSKRSPNT